MKIVNYKYKHDDKNNHEEKHKNLQLLQNKQKINKINKLTEETIENSNVVLTLDDEKNESTVILNVSEISQLYLLKYLAKKYDREI